MWLRSNTHTQIIYVERLFSSVSRCVKQVNVWRHHVSVLSCGVHEVKSKASPMAMWGDIAATPQQLR